MYSIEERLGVIDLLYLPGVGLALLIRWIIDTTSSKTVIYVYA